MEMKEEMKMKSLKGGDSSLNNYHYLTENHSSSSTTTTSSLSSSLGYESQVLGKIICSSSSSSSSETNLGFMELLGMQNMMNISPSLFDMVINDYGGGNENEGLFPSSLDPPAPDPTPPPNSSDVKPESSEVLNDLPTTPKSSSISSASNDEQQQNQCVDEQEQDQQKAKKQWTTKAKKTNQKRQREPRFAFMTKSEVDHLEDGYRWRKYGQKAVKNSPYPRSYYRCTSASCNVKKRVERSFTDPSIVVTTYEGQHIHPCTVLPRGIMPGPGFGSGLGAGVTSPLALPMQMANNNSLLHRLQVNQVNNLVPQLNHFGGNIASPNVTSCSTSFPLFAAQNRRFCAAAAPVSSALVRDNGLLQDIVPSIMNKEE